MGLWLDHCESFGAGVRFFALGNSPLRFRADSNEFSTIARPFFNVVTDMPDATRVAEAGFSTGAIAVDSDSDVVGGDVFGRLPFLWIEGVRIDLVAGYQAARIDEDLLLRSTTLLPNAQLDIFDEFDTKNEFHGGTVGLWAAWGHAGWSFDVLAMVGLGNMRQEVHIDGLQTNTVPGQMPVMNEGGLLAQPANIGLYSRDRFVVAPELALNVAYRVTPSLDLTLGYSLLYWNHVVQPGDQIDLSVNSPQPPPPTQPQRPAFEFRETDYWLHGINLGVRMNY